MQYLIFMMFLLASIGLAAQCDTVNPFAGTEEEVRYERDIVKSQINNIYIPKDLFDAFNRLEALAEQEGLQMFRGASEEDIKRNLHFGLGRWMIINWRFYEGSRLSHFLRCMSIDHPDEMAEFIILTFHRYLNERPLEVEVLVEDIKAKRKERVEERERRAIILDTIKPAARN